MNYRYMAMGAAVMALAACAPADVAGAYSFALTYGQNGCNISNWTTGSTTQNVPVTFTQNGSATTGIVSDANPLDPSRIGLDLLLGSHTFVGTVAGATVDAKIDGTRSATQGACTYTYRARVVTSLSSNTLSGTLTYTALTNGHADCGTLTGCSSVVNIAGVRPPR